jgi:hypothetical protein
MRGLNKTPRSNRRLANRLKTLNRINFCCYENKFIFKISCLKTMGMDIHDFFPTDNSFIYRAVINTEQAPYNSINWIRFNPKPDFISRANLKHKGTAYYSCAPDISIIESCMDKLKSTDQREFELTVSKWEIMKKLSFQIICNSQKAQSSGTDLAVYCKATNEKRRKELRKKYYRTYFLKARFLSDQYAKGVIKCENDYYISAFHANSILKPENKVDGIIYPSVQYLYKGFNYAFAPRLFENSYFKIKEVYHYKVKFNNKDIHKYPELEMVKSSSNFENDNIIW